jgi:HEAT repeat protein/beta-lactamase regulating signal transducer with metallopeptidase domain
MNTLETWRSIIEVLGWTLIHFTWQGTLVALSLAGVLWMLRGSSTNARYAAACVALLLMSSTPLFTMAIISHSTPDKTVSPQFVAQPAPQPQPVEIEPAIVPAQRDVASASLRPWLFIRPAPITPLLRWMILLWLLGVVLFSLRLAGGWFYTQRLKSYGTRPLGEGWEQTLRRLCNQLRAPRPALLLESALVKVPMVIGWLRPVILLPAGALIGLSPQQLEAIIAHELAHIRRHDYLINLLQAVVETLLFYHPAVWWVSRKIRQEREHCCDDLAVAACGDALTYARALLEMEQLRAAEPQLAVAANGGLLMNRIQRLVGAQPKHANRFSGLFASVIALTTLISAVAGAQILLQSSSRADREVVSALEREAMKVNTIAGTPGESNRDGAGQPLINALRDQHEQVREAAAKSLGIIGDRRALEPLSQALQDADEQAPQKAVEALGRLKQSGGDSTISMNALHSSNATERAFAACALGRLGAVNAIPALISLLGDETPIQSIKCWDSGDWSPARHTFKQASPGEQAAIALAALSQPAVEPLIAALSNGDPIVRRNSAWAIGEIRGGRGTDRTAAVEPLIATLRDEDSWVRVAAAFSLGEIQPSQATESLIAALGDAEWNVRWMAAWALGEMKARAAVESLTSLSLRDENEWVRRKAAQALGEIRDSQADKSREIKTAGRLANVTRTEELSLPVSQLFKMARLKINGRIESGNTVWTLRNPNGKSVFTAETGNAELSLDSGDLDVIPGTWKLQIEVKNATLDFEVRWTLR